MSYKRFGLAWKRFDYFPEALAECDARVTFGLKRFSEKPAPAAGSTRTRLSPNAMTTVTPRWAVLLLALLAAPAAMAQQTSLGNEFIFFVDGTNVLVPTIPEPAPFVVSDPLAPASGNKVARFANGGLDYQHKGFQFASGIGADATGLVGDTFADSDTLYFRINSDPANASAPNLSLQFTDKTNGGGGTRVMQEAGNDTDNEFRLVWKMPAYLSDGQWHTLAIPLPPRTYDALEAAKAAAIAGTGTIDSLAARWQYTGSWSAGGFGIGSLDNRLPADDPLWREFEWNALYKFGPVWDYALSTGPSGPIYMDNVYIGTSRTSIADASAAPTAMSGVSFSADGPANTISWGQISDASGYLVYASLSPITDVKAANVVQIARRSFTEGLSVTHRFEIPHPSIAVPAIYYAVTTLSGFGVENVNVAASSGQIANASLPVAPYIRGLTEDEVNVMFDALEADTVVDGFPADQPVFRVNEAHRSPGDGTAVAALPTDADNSAMIKIGFSALGELVAYGEITDDALVFGPASITGMTTYGFDSAEFGLSPSYDVRDVPGGDILIGSAAPGHRPRCEPGLPDPVRGQAGRGGERARRSSQHVDRL